MGIGTDMNLLTKTDDELREAGKRIGEEMAMNQLQSIALTGCDLLQRWIERDPSNRVIDRMVRMGNKCQIKLRSKSGSFESKTQETFDGAIRTVLMIAMNAGEK